MHNVVFYKHLIFLTDRPTDKPIPRSSLSELKNISTLLCPQTLYFIIRAEIPFLVEDVLFLPNEFKPTRNNSLITIPFLYREYQLKLEFWIESSPSAVTLIHLTNLDSSTHAKGGKTPSIYLLSISKWTAFSWVGGRSYHKYYGALSLKKWYTVEISQKFRYGEVGNYNMTSHIAQTKVFFFQYLYQVRLDGNLVDNKINTTPSDFYDVKVYAGSPWNNALDGKIRNLRISNMN